MKKVKITAIRKTEYPDLMAKYENPIEHPCEVEEGMTWVSVNGEKPENFCNNAWEGIAPFVKTLAAGGGDFYDGWMKNPKSAMISCNDGFRPVSFSIRKRRLTTRMLKNTLEEVMMEAFTPAVWARPM